VRVLGQECETGTVRATAPALLQRCLPGSQNPSPAPELVERILVDVEADRRVSRRVHAHERGQQVLLRRAGACRTMLHEF